MRLDRLRAVLLAFLILNLSSSPGATEATRAELAPPIPARDVGIDRSFGRMPSYFVENRGQIDGRVGYYLQGRTAAFFTGEGITYAFSKRPDSAHNSRHGTEGITLASMKPPAELPEPPAPPEPQRWAVAIDLVGARRPLWPEGDDLIPTIVSYFKGPQSQWKTALPTYQTVVYRDVWPGIDLDYTVKSGQMKYTFVVKPGADPRAIKLRYRGAASIEVVDGELLVETPLGGIRDQKPLVYQDVDGCREEVSARHTLRKDGDDYVASFKLGRYDHARPLVIDPVVLAYCGYIGGGGEGPVQKIAVDAAGNAYVTGTTYVSEAVFPVTVGPDLTFNGLSDVYVAKVRADGTGLVYAGFIGGSGTDGGPYAGIAVDIAGNAYVTNMTASSEATFPVTVGPDLTYSGSTGDAFVAKVSYSPGCPAAVAAVADLRAVKQRASLDDIDLSWASDPVASAYNIWYVTRKVDIDLARQASQPPAMGVAACSAPAPAPGNACTDFGAVSRGAPTVFFYQVRASCDALSEGP
jgi:hypothetical protein